jgi:Domain of unknown function (DUF4380)
MNTPDEKPAADSPCTIEVTDYRGWESVRLSNGMLDLFVAPQIGGRVIQLRLGGQEYFYVNPRHLGRVYGQEENNCEAGWKNYGGSKVWPAPQGWSRDSEWPGPPDPILDGGSYGWQILEKGPGSVAVHLEGVDDEYTGLRFSREIRLSRGSATVQIGHKIRNVSQRLVRWAIWQVTQQAGDQDISIFVPAKSYRQIFGDERYADVEILPERNLWRLRYANQVAKFAVIPEDGWMATLHAQRGMALVETFPFFRDDPYPDGAPLEFWINGQGSFTLLGETINMQEDPNGCDPYIETEVLSPLIDLEPGQQYAFPVFWHCSSIHGGAIAKVNCCAAIAEPLTAKAGEGKVQVRGSFGLFRSGILEIAGIHRNGRVGTGRVVGEVSPLGACPIDESIAHETGLFRVALRLRDSEGKFLGTVDEALIA